jgi:hypothetical protein
MPDEALKLGLLDPKGHLSMFDLVASKSQMVQMQSRLNPRTWEWVLADKAVFYKFAAAAGLPIPRVLGTFHKTTGGWAESGRTLRTAEDWTRFLMEECPPDIVIKPTRSFCGKGVRVLHRQGDVLIDGRGRGWTPAEVVDSLRAHSKSAHVIQERIFNHEDLAVLSGGPGLQTIRLMTVLTRSGKPQIVGSFFRAIVGSNWIDNIDMGRTGNLWVTLDSQTGRMLNVTIVGKGIRDVTHHPDTGRQFAGETIPLWPDVVDLAFRAARAMAPVRTIGWDIAVTPTGPVLVEGNFWYGPPNGGRSMKEVFSVLAAELPPKSNAG